MNIGKKDKRLAIAVINELSYKQLAVLRKQFEQLPNKLNVLAKQMPRLS